MSKPRPYTVSEMRQMVLDHIREMTEYWARADLQRPEFQKDVADNGEVLYRLEGLAFSILVMLDGGSMGIPGLDLVPSPHPTDRDYHRENGENWWEPKVINDCQLHETWSGHPDR